MTPQQTLRRGSDSIHLLLVKTATAAMLPTPLTLAMLARACGRAQCARRRLRNLLNELAYLPRLPDHDDVVLLAHMTLDELVGARRVARVVATTLALREREHRALIERAMATEVAHAR